MFLLKHKPKYTTFQPSRLSNQYHLSSNICLIFLIKSNQHHYLVLDTVTRLYKLDIQIPEFIDEYKGRVDTKAIAGVWLITPKAAEMLLQKTHTEGVSLKTDIRPQQYDSETWCQTKLKLLRTKIPYHDKAQHILAIKSYPELKLAKLKLTDADLVFIINFIGTAKITSLDLSHNLITDKNATKLTTFINQNTSIKTILLNNNQLGFQTAKLLSKVLKVITTIKEINLLYNHFSFKDIYCLHHNLNKNPKSDHIRLELNLYWPRNKVIALGDVLEICEYSQLSRFQCLTIYRRIKRATNQTEIDLLTSLLIRSGELGALGKLDNCLELMQQSNLYKNWTTNRTAFDQFLQNLQNPNPALFQFDANTITKSKCLGGGTFGEAWQIRMTNETIPLAMKYNLRSGLRYKNIVIAETKKMNKLRNKYVLPVYGGYENVVNNMQYHMVMQDMSNNSLRLLLSGDTDLNIARTDLSYEQRWKLAINIAKAIKYAHDRNILHRDLKPGNVLIDKDFRAKLTDFGEAKQHQSNIAHPSTKTFRPHGTPQYIAPEILKHFQFYQTHGHFQGTEVEHTSKGDIYSFGIILWDLCELSGEIVYEDLVGGFSVSDVIQGTRRPSIKEYFPPTLKRLMQCCWHQDPQKRPTIDKILEILKTHSHEAEQADLFLFISKCDIQQVQRLITVGVSLRCKNQNNKTPLEEVFSINSDDYYKLAFLLLNSTKGTFSLVNSSILQLATTRYVDILNRSNAELINNPQNPNFEMAYFRPLVCFCLEIKIYFILHATTYYGILYEAAYKKHLPLGFLRLMKEVLSIIKQMHETLQQSQQTKIEINKLDQAQQLNFEIIRERIILPLLAKFTYFNPQQNLNKYLIDILKPYFKKRRQWFKKNPHSSLIIILANYAGTNGWSPANVIKNNQQQELFKQFFSSVQSNCIIKGIVMPDSNKKDYYLPIALVNTLFDRNGKPRSDPKYSSKKSIINKFDFQNKTFFIKFKQDSDICLLGREYVVYTLHRLLGGSFVAPGTALRLTITLANKKPKTYWVWISEQIPGSTLTEVIDMQPQMLQQLNPESYTQLFVLAMLIYPADAHPGNFIVARSPQAKNYSLISIDNGETFVNPNYSAGGIVKKEYVNIKTIIYMLSNIGLTLAPITVEKLLYLNSKSVLRNLNLMIKHINKFYQPLLEKGLEHILTTQRPKYAKLIDLSTEVMQCIALRLNYILQIIKENFLSKEGMDNHWRMLAKLDPKIAAQYTPFVGKIKTAADFCKINPKAYIITPQTGRIVSQITSKVTGSHVKNTTLSLKYLVTSMGLDEKYFKKIDFATLTINNQPDIDQQRFILGLMSTIVVFTELNLSNCAAVTDQLLASIIERSSDKLKYLNLSNCPLITEKVVNVLGSRLGAKFPMLETLILDNNPQLTSFVWTRNYSKNLQTVSLMNCGNIEKIKINYPPKYLKVNKIEDIKIANAKKYAENWDQQSLILMEQGNFHEMFKCFEWALEFDPKKKIHYAGTSKMIIYACMSLAAFKAAKIKPSDIMQSHEVQKSIRDLLQTEKPGKKIKAKLLDWVLASKKHPSLGDIAAVSITLLNIAGVSFSRMDLSGINIPGAYLPRVMLLKADLRGANLTDVILADAYMRKTNLQNSIVTGINVGVLVLAHIPAVHSIAYSPDGELLAMGCGNKDINIWDTETFKCIHTLIEHTSWVHSVSWHPDPKLRLLASGSDDKTVRVWDGANNGYKNSKELRGHTNDVRSVSWHPNPKLLLLASGSDDNTVQVWDGTKEYKNNIVLRDHTDEVKSVSWHPNPKLLLLASGSRDKTVRLWDGANDYKDSKVLRGHTSWIHSVSWHPNPELRLLASGSGDGKVRVWDGTKGYQNSIVFFCHARQVNSVSWHPNPKLKLLASGSDDKTVRVWDGANGYKISKILRGHTHRVESVSWYPDPNLYLLASGSYDHTVRIWDGTREYKNSKEFCGHTNDVNSVSWHPNPNLQLLASGSKDRTVRVWDETNGYKNSKELSGYTDGVKSVSWHPDSKLRLLASGSNGWDNGEVQIWDGANGYQNSKKLRGHTKSVHSISWHPNPRLRLLASGSSDNTVWVWDGAKRYQNSKTLRGHTSWVNSISWHPDPKLRLLASGSGDNKVRLWDGANGYKNSTVLCGHTKEVNSVSWHPNPKLKLLASGSGDNTVRLWDGAKEYKNSKELRGHIWNVSSISWHPNPKLRLLASGSEDRTVRLWDTKTTKCILVVNIENRVLSVAFSKDGKFLAIGCQHGTVIIYKYKVEKNKMILYWSTDFVCSKANFQGAIGLSPRNFRLLQQRGAIKTTMLDEKSQATLQQAWRLKQQGLILYNKQQYQQALICFQEAVQLAPANKHYQAYVAKTLQQLQNPTLPNASQMKSLPSPQTLASFTEPKKLKIKQPKFGSYYWYSARDIEKLLNHYAAEFGDVDILTPMVASGIGECKVMLFQNLEEYEKQRRAKLSKKEPIKDKVLMPLHINTNHWVLLIINYNKDLNKPHDIYYFDPKGGKIPQELIDILQHPFLYQGSCVIKLQNQINHVQTDGWNCGPWIIVAARFICAKGVLPPATINMSQIRIEHKKIQVGRM